jgi:hypothetical protein
MSSETREDRARPPPEEFIDRAVADPALTPAERETTIGFAVDEAAARVHTAEASLVRRLLAHGGAEVREVALLVDGADYLRLPLDEAVEETGGDDLIVALQASLPVRYITIGSVGRKGDEHAPVVSEEVFSR